MVDCILRILMEYQEIIIELIGIVIALITVFGVFFTAFITWKNNNKNLLIKTVTEERAKWRTELRNYCAEFSKLVYEQTNDTGASNKPRIIELKAHIKLRTNPSDEDKHKLDQDILKESQEIVNQVDENGDKEKIIEKLLNLESNVQKLLKQEWDKSKYEANSGKLGGKGGQCPLSLFLSKNKRLYFKNYLTKHSSGRC